MPSKFQAAQVSWPVDFHDLNGHKPHAYWQHRISPRLARSGAVAVLQPECGMSGGATAMRAPDRISVPDRQRDSDGATEITYRNRRLTAILISDAVGYSRLVQNDEMGTIEALRAARRAMAQIASLYCGRIAGGAGDSILAEFPSALAAVAAAVDFQTHITQQNSAPPPWVAIEFRIGIHLGDVIAEEGTILGDSVNLAARLQSTAEIGGILISRAVYDEVRGKLPITFRPRGRLRPKISRISPLASMSNGGSRPARRFASFRFYCQSKLRDPFEGFPSPLSPAFWRSQSLLPARPGCSLDFGDDLHRHSVSSCRADSASRRADNCAGQRHVDVIGAECCPSRAGKEPV